MRNTQTKHRLGLSRVSLLKYIIPVLAGAIFK